MQDRDIFAMED